MVLAGPEQNGQSTSLVIRPNAAPELRTVLGGFLIVSVPILVQALLLTAAGLWPTLPYALAVVAALAISMRIGYRYTQQREVVVVSGEQVAIEKGHRELEERHEFPRGWARVVLTEEARLAGSISHLFIQSHGRRVEVGRFLDDRERHDLARRLAPLMGPDRDFDEAAAGDPTSRS
jgi:uncharacterized membrane protein